MYYTNGRMIRINDHVDYVLETGKIIRCIVKTVWNNKVVQLVKADKTDDECSTIVVYDINRLVFMHSGTDAT